MNEKTPLSTLYNSYEKQKNDSIMLPYKHDFGIEECQLWTIIDAFFYLSPA